MTTISAGFMSVATARRAAIYVRVSSDEQVQGYSLDAQEHAGRLYCEMHGWKVAKLYRDEGRSARTEQIAKRPAFAQMLKDAEAGLIDVVIVHKLDRFARNLVVTIETLQRLEQAGVSFVSISEQMDFSTPIGKMTLSMLASLAQYYSDNLSWETKKGKAERKRQGFYNGLLPFGVTTNAAGIPVLNLMPWACNLDTREELSPAAGLLTAFKLAAERRTDKEIAQALNAVGYRTSGNRGQNPFTKDTVRAILRNRFYLGELPDGNGGWLPGKHGTLIGPVLFERADLARRSNLRRPRRVSEVRSPWALSGLATCASCGKSMTSSGRSDGRRRIQCSGRVQGTDCTEPTFFADVVESQIGTVLSNFDVDPVRRKRLISAYMQGQQHDVSSETSRKRLQRQLQRLRDLYLEGDLNRMEYQDRRNETQRQLDALPAPSAGSDEVAEQLAEYLSNLALAWNDATPEERNRMARELFSEAVMANKTAVAVVPRPEIRPFFSHLFEDEITYRRKRRDSNPRSQP
jgi:site-specific DNA recombinase